jgi:hypothetical protein
MAILPHFVKRVFTGQREKERERDKERDICKERGREKAESAGML